MQLRGQYDRHALGLRHCIEAYRQAHGGNRGTAKLSAGDAIPQRPSGETPVVRIVSFDQLFRISENQVRRTLTSAD